MHFDDRARAIVTNRARIALVTQGYETAGGVQTVARWLVKGLQTHGYLVHVFDLATARDDSTSRRIVAPRSWVRRSLHQESLHDATLTRVGCNAVELEPMRYQPRQELTQALWHFDIVQVVAGGPALARTTLDSGRPVILQVATIAAWERASQFGAGSSPLAAWRAGMTNWVSHTERKALRAVTAVLVENARMERFVRSRDRITCCLRHRAWTRRRSRHEAPVGGKTATCFRCAGSTTHARGWIGSSRLTQLCWRGIREHRIWFWPVAARFLTPSVERSASEGYRHEFKCVGTSPNPSYPIYTAKPLYISKHRMRKVWASPCWRRCLVGCPS